MFTVEQIKAAHAKVKSGADFPAYIQDITALGVTGYSTYVMDGHTDYNGQNSYHIHSPAKYPAQVIASISNMHAFKHYLSIHQQGQTDYPTFCRQAAETGVEKWVVNMQQMTCSYYDLAGNTMLVEKIPG